MNIDLFCPAPQPSFQHIILLSAPAHPSLVPQVVPVFVFSLERAPDQMLFDNHQLVAAGHDIVMVLQLLGNVSGRGGANFSGTRRRTAGASYAEARQHDPQS